MKKNNLLQLGTLLIGVFFLMLSACGPKIETAVSIQTEATAVGPFFAGPNSLIAEYEVDFASIEGLESRANQDLKEIKIRAINVRLRDQDSTSFEAFQSASLQLVGANTGMQSIAIKNPISSTGKEINLDVSDEADIVEFFKDDKFSLVLDLDFVDDSYAEELGATITLELTVKHN
jgi:hypothetical protein